MPPEVHITLRVFILIFGMTVYALVAYFFHWLIGLWQDSSWVLGYGVLGSFVVFLILLYCVNRWFPAARCPYCQADSSHVEEANPEYVYKCTSCGQSYNTGVYDL